MSPEAAMFLASQCRLSEELPDERHGLSFLIREFIATEWKRTPPQLRRWPFPYYDVPTIFSDRESPITFQFLMRYISVTDRKENAGLGCQRSVQIPKLELSTHCEYANNGEAPKIQERRHLLAMHFFPGLGTSRFTLLSLGHLGDEGHAVSEFQADDTGEFAPIPLYAWCLRSLLISWSDEWWEVLRCLDAVVSFPVCTDSEKYHMAEKLTFADRRCRKKGRRDRLCR